MEKFPDSILKQEVQDFLVIHEKDDVQKLLLKQKTIRIRKTRQKTKRPVCQRLCQHPHPQLPDECGRDKKENRIERGRRTVFDLHEG